MAVDEHRIQEIRQRYQDLAPVMDESVRRRWAGSEARIVGYGGISAVAVATGLARTTVDAGVKELEAEAAGAPEGGARDGSGSEGASRRRRVRGPGAGRKRLAEVNPELVADLEALVNPATRGDPMSALRWTSKSTGHLATTLREKGYRVSPDTVGRLLKSRGYSLQAARKTHEGGKHPDRNAQFEYINAQAMAMGAQRQPVISVDTKKKELVGNFKNAGREWQPKGQPEDVNVYDFIDLGLGKAAPYGVYDFFRNEGWVSVGIDHDTADFAVTSIRTWWREMGRTAYPKATRVLITADCGGSNGYRVRAWKRALHQFAKETGLEITVCHLPPGTSKWNKIEHRMFSHITRNWRGRPLLSHEVVVNLIGSTTTNTGLKINAALDANTYPTGVGVSDAEMAALNLKRHEFHGDWNYTLLPNAKVA